MKRITLAAIFACCAEHRAAVDFHEAKMIRETINEMWSVREAQGTRYATAKAPISQPKRRLMARRAHPHGF